MNPAPIVAKLSQLARGAPCETFVLDGRVHSLHSSENSESIDFVLRDEDNFALATVDRISSNASLLEIAKTLTRESLVRVSGSLLIHTNGVNGAATTTINIQVSSLLILSMALPNIPYGIVHHSEPGVGVYRMGSTNALLNQRLDNRIMDLRVAANAAVVKLFSSAYQLSIEHLTAEDFHWTPTPTLLGYKTPGDNDYFEVPYFGGKTAWLTQTGEVHLAMALAADLERVYDVHSVFRREPNVSTRHLTEFTLIEVGFVLKYGWLEVLDRTERMILFLLRSLQERERYKILLEQASRLYPKVGTFKLGLDRNGHLLQVTFQNAKKILAKLGSTVVESDDFSSEEEAMLGRYVASQDSCLGPPSDIFVITQYPRHIRPYNFHPAKEDSENISNSFDIIIRGQESATGLHLINSHEDLKAAMIARNPPIDPDSSMWHPYTAAHEVGMPPHGGFGRKAKNGRGRSRS